MKEFAHHNMYVRLYLCWLMVLKMVLFDHTYQPTKPTKGTPKCLNVDLMLWFGVQIAFFLVQNIIVLIEKSISEILKI